MANIIEDGINFGMGLFAYSREKIEELVEKMVEKGEIQKKDAQSFASELVKKGDAQRKELHDLVTHEVRTSLQEIGLASGCQITKDELRAIIREEIAAAKREGNQSSEQ
jgi:polyhydroxyalkanoate synthesis regulator phasin